MIAYVGQIVATAVLFLGLGVILGIYTAGMHRFDDYEKRRVFGFMTGASFGISAVLFLLAIWGPSIF